MAITDAYCYSNASHERNKLVRQMVPSPNPFAVGEREKK